MADNHFLRAALYYAGRKWPVFPIWWAKNGRCACGKADCAHPGKHPIGKLAPKGRNSATTDPKIIKGWWKQYPTANIGLPTGPESGLVVVDIDPRNGGDRKDLERLGDFLPTPTAQTGGGGEHILLKHPGRKIKSKEKLGGLPGIDQKGNGGYIVAPPSSHISGGVYFWKIKPDIPLADIPTWLMPLLIQEGVTERQQAHQGVPRAGTTNTRQPGEEYAAYAQKALADELAKLARTPEGGRNAALNESAFNLGQLIGAGTLGRGEVEAGLSGTAATIGLGETEARATIHSGIEAGLKEPRQLPEKAATKASGPRQGKGPASPEQGKQAGQDEAEIERIGFAGHTYCVKEGRLCLAVYGGKEEAKWEYRTLANFQARIEEEITRDDGGQKKTKEFKITGSLDTGRALPPAVVAADKFEGMGWIKQQWGAWAAIAPGTSLKSHAGNAIQAHSQGKTPKTPAFRQRTVYAHSGWRKIGAAWRYLHGGGAIGPGEMVEVDLGENLGNYCLPDPGGLEAAQASLRFLDVAPWEVTAPLLAAVYLAPFADLLKVDFSLWLYGPTGSMKSTLAALALCHFGNFDRRTLPGSWISTANYLEKLTFILKDSLCVIDDYFPPSSQRENSAMSEKTARTIYSGANKSGRGRLDSNTNARPTNKPRSLIVSTAEILLPSQNESARSRYLAVELNPKKFPIDKDRLTAAQGEAGLYAGAMAAYLEDLAPRLEEAQGEMQALFEAYRGVFQNGTHHARIPETQAWLTVGFERAMNFFVRLEALSEGQAHEMLNRAWKVFEALGDKHNRIIQGEKPTLKFLAVLNDLFLSSRIFVESAGSSALSKGAKPPREYLLGWTNNDTANGIPAGWADESMVYLNPTIAFKEVQKALREANDFLPLGKNDLLEALAREGFIEKGRDGENTQPKWIGGGTKRVICLPRKFLGHDETREDDKE